jgi:photosystem II stability/assembly factor-like uncharacterized protein
MRINSIKYPLFLILFFSTINLNSQWKTQNIPEDIGFVLSVDFYDLHKGIAGGWADFPNFSGRLIYTTNSGIDWNSGLLPDSARSLVRVQMLSQLDGYAFGAYNSSVVSSAYRTNSVNTISSLIESNLFVKRDFERLAASLEENYFGMMLRTTDGGATWQNQGKLPGEIKFIVDASFPESETGYILTDTANFGHSGILKTTDYGNSWVVQADYDTSLFLRKIQFCNLNTGVAAGYKGESGQFRGVIYITENGGLTWEPIIFQDVGNFTDIYWVNEETVFAAGISGQNEISGVVYRSYDRGQNWSKLEIVPDAEFFDAIRFVHDSPVGILSGTVIKFDSMGVSSRSPVLYRTNDGGGSWSQQQLPDDLTPETFFFGGDLVDYNNWFINGGYISRGMILFTDNGGLNSIGDDNTQPSDFLLFQNFPNPFNPSTTVRFFLPERGRVDMRLFDIKGELVKVLIRSEMNGGIHDYYFNGGDLSSGVYLLKMSYSGSVKLRKLLLLR